jgi:hypothetical protein
LALQGLTTFSSSGCAVGLVEPKLIKSCMAAGNYLMETLSTTSSRHPWPSATTFLLLPLTRGVAFQTTPYEQIYTQHRVGHLVISFGSTKQPPAQPEDGDEVSLQNIGKPSHLDATVCLRKFRWILSPRKLQDLDWTSWGLGAPQ